MEVRLELGRGHLDAEEAKTSGEDARGVFEIGDGLLRQHSAGTTSWRRERVVEVL